MVFEGKAPIPGSELKPGNPFQAENFRKMAVAMARDIRVVLASLFVIRILFPLEIGAIRVIFERKAPIPGSELKPRNPF